MRKVTIGNFFKHMMMYKDGWFFRHPYFRFFALNTGMRWHSLQVGRLYIQEHPHIAQLSIQDLGDMVEVRRLF